ncbi:MAG: Ig-like domain-containing protein, partial [Acidobacteriota bacterium]
GATQQFTATGTYSDGSTQNITSTVTWTSSATSVATINAAGLATGVAAGSATMTAALSGVTATANLTVTAAVATITSVSVTPASASIAAGATQQFTATATYSNGTTTNVTSTATWTSSNTAAATINSSGLASGVAAGSTTITAAVSGVAGKAALTVTAASKTVTSITVTPAGAIIPTKALFNFHATAAYSDGSTADITSTATWSSSSTAAATIAPGGFAYGVSPGTTTISASLSGVTGSVSASVKTVSKLTIAPTSATIAAKATQQFTAEATYTDSTQQDVTTLVPWTSTNSNYATINSSGLATGVLPGTTDIGANYGGYAADAVLNVTNATGQGFDVLTWHVDNTRSGLNSQETTLTPSNVNSTTFGKLFSISVDGYVYASPLIVSNLSINGALHNVLYVATEYDSVYAFDADTGAQLWQVSLLQSGETPLSGAAIKPWLGITSTPVIDRSTGTLYVVSAQTSAAAGGTFRLHALDITNGGEKLAGPVTLNVSVPATNSDSVNGVQTLTTSCIQRAALLEANGNIYIGFGSCHSGWLVAYNALSLKLAGVFNASTRLDGEGPYASAGGVWMGGGGPVADSSGNVYITTGNGPWNGTDAWGDSILKFPPKPVAGANGTMQPSDYFTPSIYQYMDCNDADLAAGGLMMIPGTTSLIAGGKTGTMFLVDSNSLGHESANDSGAIQEQVWGAGLPSGNTYPNTCTDATGTNNANVTSYEIFGTSAYFNNYVYLGVTPTSSTAPGGVRQFEYSGTLSPFADASPTINQGTRGTSPFISANGSNNGIVWMIDEGYPIQNTQNDPSNPGTTEPPTNATLYAYNAASYPTELYDSSQNSADTPGYGIKFTSPIVANGKVYISTGHDLPSTTNPHGEIDVYGLK